MTESVRFNFIGVVFALGVMVSMLFMLLYLIDSTIESIPSEISYCDDVYDRPEDFKPEDGTMEEKYDNCVNFVEVTGPQLKENMETTKYFVYAIPILGVVYVAISLFMSTRSPNDTNAYDRKEYDPDFKGYGK